MIPREREIDLLKIGLLAARWGHLDVARTILSALAMTHPDRGAPHIGLVIAHLARGQLREALACADQALQCVRADELTDVQVLRGVALAAAGRTAESVAALHRAGPHPLALDFLERKDLLERSI